MPGLPELPELPSSSRVCPQEQCSRGTATGEGGPQAPLPNPQCGDPGLAGEGMGVPWAIWGSRTVGRTRKEKGLSLGEEKDASSLTRRSKPNT